MGATLIDGKSIAEEVRSEVARGVGEIKEQHGATPGLTVILVGDDPASATYVKMKGNACQRVGIDSLKVELAEQTTTAELVAEIEALLSGEGSARVQR